MAIDVSEERLIRFSDVPDLKWLPKGAGVPDQQQHDLPVVADRPAVARRPEDPTGGHQGWRRRSRQPRPHSCDSLHTCRVATGGRKAGRRRSGTGRIDKPMPSWRRSESKAGRLTSVCRLIPFPSLPRGGAGARMNEPPVVTAALSVLAAGLSVLPIDPSTKRPAPSHLPQDATGKRTWAPFQQEPPREATVRAWHGLESFAVVAGRVSGGLLILDFDEPRFYQAWRAAVGELADGLPVQRTGAGDSRSFSGALIRAATKSSPGCPTNPSNRAAALRLRRGAKAATPARPLRCTPAATVTNGCPVRWIRSRSSRRPGPNCAAGRRP